MEAQVTVVHKVTVALQDKQATQGMQGMLETPALMVPVVRVVLEVLKEGQGQLVTLAVLSQEHLVKQQVVVELVGQQVLVERQVMAVMRVTMRIMDHNQFLLAEAVVTVVTLLEVLLVMVAVDLMQLLILHQWLQVLVVAVELALQQTVVVVVAAQHIQ